MSKEKYYWCCPYFRWESKGAVCCEAGRLHLPGGETAAEFYRCFCANNPGWRHCTAARALNLHYERLEEKEAARCGA